MSHNEKDPAGQGGVFDETAGGAVSAVQSTGPQSDSATLSPDHVAELSASAIPVGVALAAGVYTAFAADQLPESVRWTSHRDAALPALVYPMREVDGTETCQAKPQSGSVTSKDGRELKYVGPSAKSGNPPQLPFVGIRRPDGSISADPADAKEAGVVWIVEGCKQALAALARAPEGVAVFRITGIWSWMSGGDVGAPTPHLPAVCAGREAFVFGDADAATNVSVYDGLAGLGEAAMAAGAKSVKFVHAPGSGKQGLDDVLASIPDEGVRQASLRAWVEEAGAKPAPLAAAALKKMRDKLAVEQARRAAEQ